MTELIANETPTTLERQAQCAMTDSSAPSVVV
jgi:hypothetical protein